MKEYFLLEIKLLIRNKQTKNLLFISLLINLFSIVVLKNLMNSKAPLVFKTTILLFSLGYFFVFNYGRSLLSWEYGYLKDLFTKELNFRKYIYSKILIMQLYALFILLLNILFVFHTNYLFPIVSLSFFLIGVGVYVQALTSIYAVHPIKINANTLSSERQKLLPFHIIGLLTLYLFPIFLFSLFDNNYQTLSYILFIIGFIGLLLSKTWLQILTEKIVKNKYRILNFWERYENNN